MCDATRSTQRDFCRLQQIVDHFRFLRLAASTSKLDMSVFFYFFGLFVLAQPISCFSSTVMPVAVNFPADKKPVCRGRLLHVGEDTTLLSVLRVALGDNESLLMLRI